MQTLTRTISIALLGASLSLGVAAYAQAPATPAAAAPAPAAKPKNWNAPAGKIYAQKLADDIKAKHPELISVTLQGTPPDAAEKTYTMFAGSFPERIGNKSDADDVEVIVKGVTILDPRTKRNDPEKKFVILTPLKDKAGENIGLMVLAYKNHGKDAKSDEAFYKASQKLRDDTAKQIPSFKALFEPAK